MKCIDKKGPIWYYLLKGDIEINQLKWQKSSDIHRVIYFQWFLRSFYAKASTKRDVAVVKMDFFHNEMNLSLIKVLYLLGQRYVGSVVNWTDIWGQIKNYVSFIKPFVQNPTGVVFTVHHDTIMGIGKVRMRASTVYPNSVQWRRKLENFEGDGDEKKGLIKGGYPSKSHRFWHILFTAYGKFCYFSWFFFPLLYFFSVSYFIPPRNFRGGGTLHHWKF